MSLEASVYILKKQLHISCSVPLSLFHAVSPSPQEKNATIESQMRKIDKNSAVNDRKSEFPRHSQFAVRSALNKQPNHSNELYCAPLKSIPGGEV